ncbi:hypothetical protein DEO72_LG5g862 [Vigna unguiculata]|uniref:Uncharacterized protein n=1 Tax=Vigna unguiculata TaxID=3917 RepID=A0A4D6LWE7_VIGUN|nr:hypothetical protein DEO72_LG5g862 [Vigna unguiculata]
MNARTISSSQRRRSGSAIGARDFGPQVRSGPMTVAFYSGGDLNGGSSSGAPWRSCERCCHGGSHRRVADLVPCFRVAVVAGVVARVHHRSEWVRHRWVVMFALFMREVKGRGDPGD